MINIQSNYSDMFAELDRLEAMPTPKMVAGLEAMLTLGLEDARAKVHVDTGRLKAAGKKKSSTKPLRWEGEFSFTSAKNDEGVSYGMYEADRGGKHDFMSGVFLLRALFKQAMKKGLGRK